MITRDTLLPPCELFPRIPIVGNGPIDRRGPVLVMRAGPHRFPYCWSLACHEFLPPRRSVGAVRSPAVGRLQPVPSSAASTMPTRGGAPPADLAEVLPAQDDVDAVPRRGLVALHHPTVEPAQRIVVRYDLAFEGERAKQAQEFAG
jgi:hypothetical protein